MIASKQRSGVMSDVPIRPQVRGKFLYVRNEKFYIRGVTYGTFSTDENGIEIYDADVVEHDFATMAKHGINSVRTYTVPPLWLLDAAHRHGLSVMVGLPWEQHIAFLDVPGRAADIEARVRAAVRSCAAHPAVLFFSIGNELPTSIVRWHGARRIEKFLLTLYRAVKDEDPGALVTYVNYPSTEYLRLPFLDLMCFNVYLEEQPKLQAYLARLQNLAGDRPLVMAEVGLDSRRNGAERQASVLDWQIRTAFASGCAGLYVFAWTDEWHRGGHPIEDWDFGITDRDRKPKPALATVSAVYADLPLSKKLPWPRISVVVCSFNGGRTIADTCEGLRRLEYPDFEVIVVDDGSTDDTADVARSYGFRVISTENCGLSSARNTGLAAATGEIVAYTDDDARPDPHWLAYLASTFVTTDYAGVGGPNIAPPGDGWIADCVANAPGGPVHVLLSDGEAEHIPGCNMAFRKSTLEAVGGFDPRFRVAGDDVDICWRMRDAGLKIAFNPGAMVWHHRRNSVRAYWSQQRGYGRAEALLEQKWPEKYNAVGHVAWSGRLYGKGLALPLPFKGTRIYQGVGGSAPFQSVYQPAPGLMGSLPLMPEWYFLVAVLAFFSVLGLLWSPLLVTALPLLVIATAISVSVAALGGRRSVFANALPSHFADLKLRGLTAALHLIQPVARLWGRLHSGLTPWRRRGTGPALLYPVPRTFVTWRAYVLPAEGWLQALMDALRAMGAVVTSGGDFDRWDLQVRGGAFGATRLRLVIEEHGASKQLIRFRVWPRVTPIAVIVSLVFIILALRARMSGVVIVPEVFGILALVVGVRGIWEINTSLVAASTPFVLGGMELASPFDFPSSEFEDGTIASNAAAPGQVARSHLFELQE
jgi:GT2 family glycosyltransferase